MNGKLHAIATAIARVVICGGCNAMSGELQARRSYRGAHGRSDLFVIGTAIRKGRFQIHKGDIGCRHQRRYFTERQSRIMRRQNARRTPRDKMTSPRTSDHSQVTAAELLVGRLLAREAGAQAVGNRN